jgi:hypothetical protein
MTSTVTSVRLDIELYVALRKKAAASGLTANEVIARALKAYLSISSTATEDSEAEMQRILQERDAKILGAVASAAEVERATREDALADLQRYFNLYISSGLKPMQAKLNWVNSRKARYPSVAAVDGMALLEELQGHV